MSDGPNQAVGRRHRLSGADGAVGRLVLRMKRNRDRAARARRNARLATDPSQRATLFLAAAVWTKFADDAAEELERNRPDGTLSRGR